MNAADALLAVLTYVAVGVLVAKIAAPKFISPYDTDAAAGGAIVICVALWPLVAAISGCWLAFLLLGRWLR